eukprot:gene9813-18384_t
MEYFPVMSVDDSTRLLITVCEKLINEVTLTGENSTVKESKRFVPNQRDVAAFQYLGDFVLRNLRHAVKPTCPEKELVISLLEANKVEHAASQVLVSTSSRGGLWGKTFFTHGWGREVKQGFFEQGYTIDHELEGGLSRYSIPCAKIPFFTDDSPDKVLKLRNKFTKCGICTLVKELAKECQTDAIKNEVKMLKISHKFLAKTIQNVFASIATEESATDLHCSETAEVEESVEIPEDCSVSGFLNIMKTSLFNNWKVDIHPGKVKTLRSETRPPKPLHHQVDASDTDEEIFSDEENVHLEDMEDVDYDIEEDTDQSDEEIGFDDRKKRFETFVLILFTCSNSTTQKWLHMYIITKRNEVGNSPAMEFEGFKRCFNNMESAGLKVSTFVSDRHMTIRKALRVDHKDVKHYFDLWHLKKS